MSIYMIYSHIDFERKILYSPIETSIVLSLLHYTKSYDKVDITLVRETNDGTEIGDCDNTIAVDVKFNSIKFNSIQYENLKEPIKYCKLPSYFDNEYYCVSGLCSVLRQIVKRNSDVINLLGFRENCLSACAEQSTWTKFCEVDSVMCVNDFLLGTTNWINHIKELEFKLKIPLKIHNKILSNEVSEEKRFCDSMQFSLSDFILVTCIHIINLHGNQILSNFPHIEKWYTQIMVETSMLKSLSIFLQMPHKLVDIMEEICNINDSNNGLTSITKAQKARKFTTRSQDAIHFINNIEPRIKQTGVGYGDDIIINIEDIPYFALPESGDLPEDRVQRKCQQLLCMTKAVMKICNKNDVIVDFCSGGGHLGLLLAHLLPQCQVILLDNKSRSLEKAQFRAKKLNLTNIYIIQSNVDYFVGHFNIGVCLHACGVASDLVMQICKEKGASMVVSPCCYGKIQTCHTVSYPRSIWLREAGISKEEHHLMSHCADREEPAWMNWIDADRLEWATENEYNTFLGKLTPLNCTPKNNLLVVSKRVLQESIS